MQAYDDDCCEYWAPPKHAECVTNILLESFNKGHTACFSAILFDLIEAAEFEASAARGFLMSQA